jgi:transcriptional regulator with XRE-family HTH domain
MYTEAMVPLFIGKRIRALREARGVTQFDIERDTGIKREYVSKLENGHLKNPTVNTVRDIADALDLTLSEFFDYSADNLGKIVEKS